MLFILRFRKIYWQILTLIIKYDEHEFEQNLRGSKGQGSPACCSPRGYKGLDTTEWLTTTLIQFSEPVIISDGSGDATNEITGIISSTSF